MLYVQNMIINDSESEDDVVNKVKRQAKSRDVNILSGLVFFITSFVIISLDVRLIFLHHNFWPQDIACRPWQRQRRPGPPTETIMVIFLQGQYIVIPALESTFPHQLSLFAGVWCMGCLSFLYYRSRKIRIQTPLEERNLPFVVYIYIFVFTVHAYSFTHCAQLYNA